MTHHDLAGTTGKLVLFKAAGEDFIKGEYPLRPLQQGEILVKNVYTTICGSDLHTYCGLRQEPSPTVLGHEIVGTVVEIGPGHSGTDLRGNQLSPGDIITWTVFASDPDSANSRAGIPQKGDNLFKYGHALAVAPDYFHGGLGEYCILRINTALLKLPAYLPLPIAATLNCSISTVAGALRVAGDIRNKNVLITGMGHLGITCAAMCRDAGAAWIGAADIAERRLQKALDFGADETFNLKEDNALLKEHIRTHLPRRGVDIVFDMSGSPDAIELGIETLAINGTAIFIGAVFNTRKVNIDPQFIIRSLITIRGLHNYNIDDFQYALDFMLRSWERFPFEQAVEKEFPLEQTQEAFAYAVEHKPFRVGVRI